VGASAAWLCCGRPLGFVCLSHSAAGQNNRPPAESPREGDQWRHFGATAAQRLNCGHKKTSWKLSQIVAAARPPDRTALHSARRRLVRVQWTPVSCSMQKSSSRAATIGRPSRRRATGPSRRPIGCRRALSGSGTMGNQLWAASWWRLLAAGPTSWRCEWAPSSFQHSSLDCSGRRPGAGHCWATCRLGETVYPEQWRMHSAAYTVWGGRAAQQCKRARAQRAKGDQRSQMHARPAGSNCCGVASWPEQFIYLFICLFIVSVSRRRPLTGPV